MRASSRRDFLAATLGGAIVAVSADSVRASEVNERLLVSVMALKRGDLIADDAAVYTPFHRFRDQVLTLEVEDQRVRGTLMVTVSDRAAGGVVVQTCRIASDGQEYDRREFTMYPFVETAATRQEVVLLPVATEDEREPGRLSTAIDVVITMKRAVRHR